jgi:hypothetical protein
MKKDVRLQLIFIFGITLLLSMGFVAAQGSDGLIGAVEDGFGFIQPVLDILLGQEAPGLSDINNSSDYIARIMFVLIIFALVWTVMTKIPFIEENRAILWILSIAVSILATRWLSEGGVVQSLLLPYSAMGISMAAFLPLIIYFAFIEVGFKRRKYKNVRKTAWIFFMVVFVALWIVRREEVSGFVWVYPISALLCLGFFWFDGTIQKWLNKFSIDKLREAHNRDAALAVRSKMKDLKDLYKSEGDTYQSFFFPTGVSDGYKAYKKDMDKLSDELAALKS